MRHIVDTDSYDEVMIKDLINKKLDVIQMYVATAELVNWPKEMGVYPERKNGGQPK